jgi:hypothetical protein
MHTGLQVACLGSSEQLLREVRYICTLWRGGTPLAVKSAAGTADAGFFSLQWARSAC